MDNVHLTGGSDRGQNLQMLFSLECDVLSPSLYVLIQLLSLTSVKSGF